MILMVAPRERQGNLAASTKRLAAKTPNFGIPAPDPRLTVAIAAAFRDYVFEVIRKAGADRVVAEINPWMLQHRRQQAQERRAQ